MISVRQMTWRRVAGTAATVLVAAVLAPTGAATTPAASAVASDDCGDLLAKPEGGSWACTFVDNFDGDGDGGGKGKKGKGKGGGSATLESEKWLVAETSWSGMAVNQTTCLTASESNVSVSNGTLQLTARDEGKEFQCETPWGSFTTRYTGGSVSTKGRFSQTYGRFEARVKYPDSDNPGLHAAFWMNPDELTYGAWPNSGEIDVAEWWSGLSDYVLPTLHYPGRDFWADTGWDCRPGDTSQFHTYAVEWTAEEMRFFQDGNLCFRRSWEPNSPLVAPQPFDHAFNAILTMAVGPESGNNAVTSDTDLPATMEVDYIKVWK